MMTNKDNFLMISKDWLVDKEDNKDSNLLHKYGELGFGFYICCKISEQAYDNSSKVCIGEFLDMFGFTNKRTRKAKKQELHDTIKIMQEDGLITFYNDFALSEIIRFDTDVKDTEILYCNVGRLEGGFFVRLSKLEIFTIISAESNQLRLLIHYMAIMCYENLNEGYCYPSIEAIAIRAQTSRSTVLRYNEILCELGVLYIGNTGMKYIEADNSYESFSNTYGRYANKDKVDEFIIETIAKEKGKVTNTTKNKQKRANKSRSLAGKINWLDAKDNLTVEEVEELELLRVEHGELRKQIKKQQDESYKHLIPEDVKEEVEIQEDVEVIDIEPDDEPWGAPNPVDRTNDNDIDNVDEVDYDCDYGWLDELNPDAEPKIKEVKPKKDISEKWGVSEEYMEVFGGDNKNDNRCLY